MSRSNPTTEHQGHEIVITRTFDAPRDRIFKAWTDPNWVISWWGPKTFTIPYCKIDLQVGGELFYCMRSPSGQDYWSKGIYQEIIPPSRIVCTDLFADKDGNAVHASYYGMEGDWPLELLVTIDFEEIDGKTLLTLHHRGLPPGEISEMTALGWNESFDKLDQLLLEEKA